MPFIAYLISPRYPLGYVGYSRSIAHFIVVFVADITVNEKPTRNATPAVAEPVLSLLESNKVASMDIPRGWLTGIVTIMRALVLFRYIRIL